MDRDLRASSSPHSRARCRGFGIGIWLLSVVVLLSLLGLVWASDQITAQGERTVYTVECDGGAWQGAHCGGRLSPGARHRFLASKAQEEVSFWIVGSSRPPGKFTDCVVRDGRNWICRPEAEASRTITLQMSDGRPVHSASGPTQAFHTIQKWRWWLLRWDVALSDDGVG